MKKTVNLASLDVKSTMLSVKNAPIFDLTKFLYIFNFSDKKKRLEHELERLKQHLVQVEETYTQEALEAEERERELRKKLQVI